MTDSEVLLLRGWHVDRSPDRLIRSVLGDRAAAADVDGEVGQWSLLDPVLPGEPIGLPRSFVTFAAPYPATVEIVPGSQGCPPPATDTSAGVVAVELPPGSTLVLDGRCWHRHRDPNLILRRWTTA